MSGPERPYTPRHAASAPRAAPAPGRRTRPFAAVLLACLCAAAPAATPGLAQTGHGPPSVAPVAERLIDAVVNISTRQTLKNAKGVPLPKVPKNAPFEKEFEKFFGDQGGGAPNRKVAAQGSGFVIDGKEGLIVTNNHVIDGADEIIIYFHDGSKLTVEKVLGKDAKTDLALLKVAPKRPLAQVVFGSSSRLKVGDWVMAIGNPFGLGGSVSVGIISAKERDISSESYGDLLQTDAAINKGNSGGPLFNMEGEVIGVNTAIISPTGGSIGIGFAVPSDSAAVVLEQLRLYGETRRGWLGVHVRTVPEDLAPGLGLKEGAGAHVARVAAGGPAAKAGIQEGDVIVKFDGKEVISMRGLPRLVAQTQIGREVEVEVLRKGQRTTVRVTVGRLVEDAGAASGGDAAPSGKDKGGKDKGGKHKGGKHKGGKHKGGKHKGGDAAPPGRSLAGLVLAPLTDELRARHGIGRDVKGLVVTEVDPASAAAARKIKVGDVIVEVAHQAVNSVEDVAKAIAGARGAGRHVLLRLEDAKGDLRFVAVPAE